MNDINSLVISIEEFLGQEAVSYELISAGKGKNDLKLPNPRTYSIPDYQREIRWKEFQVARLIEDLSTTDKFLGSVMISTKNGTEFDIIDGQQRLTVICMIIEYICTKKKNGRFERCGFINQSIQCFDELYNIDFDIHSKSLDNNTRLEIKRKDRLNQIDRLKKIWIKINKCLSCKNSQQLSALRDNILASKINLVVNYEGRGNISKKQCILQYLDINNKSVPLDHIDILKAYLFKDNFELFSSRWADVQILISDLKCHNVEYDVQNIFYHYFLCEANKNLNWTLTGLQYKFLTPNGNSSEPKYKKGQHITEVITDYLFYDNMMTKLELYLRFLGYICSKQGIDEQFDDYCKKKNGEVLSDVSKKNIFYLSKAIIGLREQIPKMMLMKYFLEVLDKDEASSEQYKLIYYIYYCAIVFACLDEKKESKAFAALIAAQDWDSKLKSQVSYYSQNKVQELWYTKKISRMGYSLETGGQELPRHIFAIKYYWSKKPNKLEPKDPKKLCIFLSTTMERTMEHFLLNKSKKIEFVYGKDRKKGEYFYPRKVFQKYVSCPINYLVLNEEENTIIGNGSVKEKISLLKDLGNKVWGNDLVYEYFQAAIDIFESGTCPDDFEAIDDEEEVKKLFDHYFEEDFEKELGMYEAEIKNK